MESNVDLDEPGLPYTQDDAVAENIERIKVAQRDGGGYLSTSQQIMVGLALCHTDLLAAARHPAGDIKAAWARLDDSQRQAIIAWAK